MKLVVLGLSITSSWGNGHATTFRSLLHAFQKKNHNIVFLERDVPYYAENRDLANPSFCEVKLYSNLKELKENYSEEIRDADAVMVGSYVPQGVEVGDFVLKTAKGVKLFYDIDTPVTLAKLERNDFEYLHPKQIEKYDGYLSFAGGPILELLMEKYGSPYAKPLYCSVDSNLYFPEYSSSEWEMGYLGTYSDDRQPTVENFLNKTAEALPEKLFSVAGSQYPAKYSWAKNVKLLGHLPPATHRKYYNSQRYTLNVTRQDMIRAGFSPSVRLFEAAACKVPIISDYWDGLDTFFTPGSEILIAHSTNDVVEFLTEIPEKQRVAIAEKAFLKILDKHTSKVRAEELERYIVEIHSLTEKISK